MSKKFTRREFLEGLAWGTAAGATLPLLPQMEASAAAGFPQRVLGRTGVRVPILAFGGGSRFLMYGEEERGLAALELALELGVRYFDTAHIYGDGESERRIGQLMPRRRQEVFLATKIPHRERDPFQRALETSLKRLRVEQVDLLHLHSLLRADDLARLEAREGALGALREAREQKLTRFIGITSHTDGETMARAIERHDLDCVQIALNPTRMSRFEERTLAAARRKNLGVIAMKVTGQEFLQGNGPARAEVDSLLRYALSLPVATAVVGMPQLEFLRHNAAVARSFRPLSPEEMEELRHRLAPARVPLEDRFARHLDGPTRTPEVFFA